MCSDEDGKSESPTKLLDPSKKPIAECHGAAKHDTARMAQCLFGQCHVSSPELFGAVFGKCLSRRSRRRVSSSDLSCMGKCLCDAAFRCVGSAFPTGGKCLGPVSVVVKWLLTPMRRRDAITSLPVSSHAVSSLSSPGMCLLMPRRLRSRPFWEVTVPRTLCFQSVFGLPTICVHGTADKSQGLSFHFQ